MQKRLPIEFDSISGIATTPQNQIWLISATNSSVIELDSAFRLLQHWRIGGTDVGEINQPGSIGFHEQKESIFISDCYRIQVHVVFTVLYDQKKKKKNISLFGFLSRIRLM